MQFKEQATLVAVSVVLALAGAAGMVKIMATKGWIKNSPPTSEDAPIIIGGGSLYMGTSADTQLLADSGKTMLQLTDGSSLLPGRYIERVDVFSDVEQLIGIAKSSDTTFSLCTIEADYCDWNKGKSACKVGGPIDHIIVRFSGTATDTIFVTGDYTNPKSGELEAVQSRRLLPNLQVHPQKDWVLSQILINSKLAADCSNTDQCAVVVHTCTIGQDCAPCTSAQKCTYWTK